MSMTPIDELIGLEAELKRRHDRRFPRVDVMETDKVYPHEMKTILNAIAYLKKNYQHEGEAIAAKKAIEIELGYHPNHGRVK
jgi:hypothetical protein